MAMQGFSSFLSWQPVLARLAVAVVGVAISADARALDGTWTATTSGSWGTAGNWLGNTVGTGTGFTATFGPDIASNVEVTNNQQRAIGTLVFGTATAPSGPGNWLVSGSQVTMTNASTATNATITVNSLGTVTISAVIAAGTANNAALVKNGAGKLILTNTSNSISNNVSITAGTLEISDNLQLGANPGSFIADRLQISNGATLRTSAAVTLGQNRGITIGSGGGTLSINGGGLSYAGRFTGAGNTVTVTGSNALTISNATGVATDVNWDFSANSGVRTFFQGSNALGTGSVRVRNGVRLTSQSTAPTSGEVTNAVTVDSGGGLTARSNAGAVTYTNVTLPSAGSIVLNKDDSTTAGLTILSGVALTGGLTVDTSQGGSNPVGDVTLSGIFSGSGNLLKAGTGTSGRLILGGANTYTGTTTINTGTLALGAAGSIADSAAIIVASSAAFDVSAVSGGFALGAAQSIRGAGTVVGAMTANGTISPGLSGGIGTLSFANSLSLGSGSILDYQFSGTDTTVGGVSNDLSSVTGNLVLDGSLNVAETVANSFLSATVGNSWRLFNYTGTLTDNGLTLGTMPALSSGLEFNIDTATANQVNLVVMSVVPEPGTVMMALVGFAVVAFNATRRRTRAGS